jgi:hypothetical protein
VWMAALSLERGIMANRFANPRMLGSQRKSSAQKWLAASVLFLISASLFAVHPMGLLSLLCAGLCLTGALFCWNKCSKLHSASQRATIGADGEDEVFAILRGLPKGWSVERNVQLKGIGDVDLLVQAPQGRRTRSFAIDVKAHRGDIGFDGEMLYRTRRGVGEQFEKDFLKLSMQQALKSKEAFDLPFVVPVIVFARAQVPFSGEKMRGVHVLAKHDLLDFLNWFESDLVSAAKTHGKATNVIDEVEITNRVLRKTACRTNNK